MASSLELCDHSPVCVDLASEGHHPSIWNSSSACGNQPITLTLVLRRDHQAGFEGYLHEIYDPHSKNFHHFLTQRQIADRFGPSRADYNAVLAYLRGSGFKLVRGLR